jgi:elongation factor G
MGTAALMQAVVDYVPNPSQMPPVETADDGKLAVDPNGATCAFVFKTVSDQFGNTPISRSSPFRQLRHVPAQHARTPR